MSSFNSSSIAVVAATATATAVGKVVQDHIETVYSPTPVRNFYPFKNEDQMNICLALYLIFVMVVGFLCTDALIRCAEKSAPTPEQILGQMAIEPPVNFTSEVRLAGGNDNHPECAICLSEFVEGADRIRILTICKHGFHVNCIERWLLNEPSCPICRSRTNTLQSWLAWHNRQQQQRQQQQQQQQQNDVDLEASIPTETEMVVQQEREQQNDIDLEAAIPSETEMVVRQEQQQQQST